MGEIVNGSRRLNVAEASQLTVLFDTDEHFWINLQATHDRRESRNIIATHHIKPIQTLLGAAGLNKNKNHVKKSLSVFFTSQLNNTTVSRLSHKRLVVTFRDYDRDCSAVVQLYEQQRAMAAIRYARVYA